MTRLDREARVAIEALVSRGTSKAAVARLLGVSESTVRYHAGRMSAGALDGRGDKAFKAAPLAEAIGHWREAQADAAIHLAGAHEWAGGRAGFYRRLRPGGRVLGPRLPAPSVPGRG